MLEHVRFPLKRNKIRPDKHRHTERACLHQLFLNSFKYFNCIYVAKNYMITNKIFFVIYGLLLLVNIHMKKMK